MSLHTCRVGERLTQVDCDKIKAMIKATNELCRAGRFLVEQNREQRVEIARLQKIVDEFIPKGVDS